MNFRTLLFLCAALLLPMLLRAQAPLQFNFQAVARNTAGEVISEKTISVRLSISDNTPNGPVIFQEAHSVLTSKLGMFSLRIGAGSLLSGSMSAIDWASGTKYLRTEIDPNGGTSFVDLGATPFLSVPYALYAANGGTPYAAGTGISITGTTITNTGDTNAADDLLQSTLFNGDVTGTYNDLQIKAGAIGNTEVANQGLNGDKLQAMGASPGDVLKWTGSTWAPAMDLIGNGNNNYTPGTGIAINGTVISALYDNALWNAIKLYGRDVSSAAPGMGQVLKWNGSMWAPGDDNAGNGGGNYSPGLGIDINGTVISAKANDPLWNANRLEGYQVAGTAPANGQALVYNTAASRWEPQTLSGGGGVSGSGTPGYLSKWSGTNAITNSIVYESAASLGIGTTSPLARVHIQGQTNQPQLIVQGANAQDNTQPIVLIRRGDGNPLFGISSDHESNLFIGLNAGKNNSYVATFSGEHNIFIGQQAGEGNTVGTDNTVVGFQGLRLNTGGGSNTAMGSYVMFNNTTGDQNTAIGSYALQENTTGRFNAAFGSGSLNINTSGENNTAIGGLAMNASILGSDNTAIGHRAMFNSYNGFRNIAIGKDALYNGNTGNHNIAIGTGSLSYNNGRDYQVAIGDSTLFHNSQGFADPSQSRANTAIGSKVLFENTLGSLNTAVGYRAMYGNVEGDENVGVGSYALYSNGIGTENTAVGVEALYYNYSGMQNAAFGRGALYNNTLGSRNSALGFKALTDNNEGLDNTAVGFQAMDSNQTGDKNAAFGSGALGSNVNGDFNTAFGANSLFYGSSNNGNTALGYNAGGDHSTGNYNTFLGYEAKPLLSGYSNATAVGSNVSITASNQVRIGNASVTSIGGFANWTNISDGRVKTDVAADVPGLDFILKLRPVTYHLDMTAIDRFLGSSNPGIPSDKGSVRYTGFIAQEVEEAARETHYEFSGVDKPANDSDLYGVRYAEFVAPLVQAIQEQQKLIEAQQAQIRALELAVKELQNH